MRPTPADAAGAVPGSGRAAGRRLVRRIGRDERRRVGGVAGDRLAGMEHVEIAALDRGLGLDLAAAAPGLRLDRHAVLDHLERPLRPLQLGDDLVADPAAILGRMEGPTLLGVLVDGFE